MASHDHSLCGLLGLALPILDVEPHQVAERQHRADAIQALSRASSEFEVASISRRWEVSLLDDDGADAPAALARGQS
jgi:hypothetical protein